MAIPIFDDAALFSLSEIISENLTHTKISTELSSCNIPPSSQGTNKRDRIFYALKEKQQQDRCGNNILAFIANQLNPKKFSDEVSFENYRGIVNEKLSFEGLEIDKTGRPKAVSKATTISEAKERSQKLKTKIHGVGIHHEVLRFCEEQWLQENYFHAILESTKSVAERIRQMSGRLSDGADLLNECFSLGKDKKPILAINKLETPSEESEQKGFVNFCIGFFSMYRNPKAHNPKINEDTQLKELIEVLVIASIIHQKLDNTFKTGY